MDNDNPYDVFSFKVLAAVYADLNVDNVNPRELPEPGPRAQELARAFLAKTRLSESQGPPQNSRP